MGGGTIHFSLDDLPARFRPGVEAQLRPSPARRQAATAPAADQSSPKTNPQPQPQQPKTRNSKARRSRSGGKGPNGTETRFNRDVLGGIGVFEGVSFNLSEPGQPACRYTPDFVTWDDGGRMTCYEVKGSHPFPSENRARTAFLMARRLFRHVRFRWFRYDRKQFSEELVEVGQL